MTNKDVDKSKRQFLTNAMTVVGAVGTGFIAVPFIAQMAPSVKSLASGASVEYDISKLDPGQIITVEWQRKPVWILRRTEASLASLAKVESQLRDPKSDESLQPSNSKNQARSIKPEIFVAIGICTHLACSPTYRPEIGPADLGNDWKGGFFCACHGSRFDIAGRVFQGVPAPTNLVIPDYRYIDDNRIIIGEDSEEANA